MCVRVNDGRLVHTKIISNSFPQNNKLRRWWLLESLVIVLTSLVIVLTIILMHNAVINYQLFLYEEKFVQRQEENRKTMFFPLSGDFLNI